MNQKEWDEIILAQSLGELQEPIAALVSECLQRHPDLERKAAQFRETAQLARKVLKAERSRPLPALQLPSEERVRALGDWFAWTAKWAAGLALAFTLGLLSRGPFHRWNRPVQISLDVQSAPASGANRGNESSDFWSIQRRYKAESTVGKSDPRRLQWRSPVRKPVIIPGF
jgi:hypothetical protein